MGAFLQLLTSLVQTAPACALLSWICASEAPKSPLWLVERGRLHFNELPPESLSTAASLLVADRKAARAQHCYLPGLAEYLDLLRALAQLGEEGLALLPKLKQFYFDKQPASLGMREN